MKAGKILLITAIIIIPLIGFGFMGLRSFTKSVINSRDCEWANIDNIEMRTRTDIPATLDCDCKYDISEETKKVVFRLDKEHVNLKEYALKNKFSSIKADDKRALSEFSFEKNPTAFTDTKDLYYREGSTKWEQYKLVLNSETGQLWVYLKYLD